MKERKFNLFNWQPFYILVVLLIFSGYIQHERQNHPINTHNKIITAFLTNEIEVPSDPNDDNSVALHSKFSNNNPFNDFPVKESIYDICLNNSEAITFCQADKNIVKTLFRFTGIHKSKMCWFLSPLSVHSLTGVTTFLVLRV